MDLYDLIEELEKHNGSLPVKIRDAIGQDHDIEIVAVCVKSEDDKAEKCIIIAHQ